MGIFKKGSKIYSTFGLKCPRCHEGDLFETGTFEFNKPFEMPKSCAVCNQNFEPEPGFYYGAMFISYIFMGWFCIGFVGILHWVLKWSIAASFITLIIVSLLMLVWLFRTSRSVWININVGYDPKAAQR
ncbi:MAG: DUF983 domain-containing protein [Saprospiraceae bacterium]